MRIVALDNPLRYLTINKDGAICIWSSNMVLEKVTFTDPELEDVNGQKRRFKVNRFCELPGEPFVFFLASSIKLLSIKLGG